MTIRAITVHDLDEPASGPASKAEMLDHLKSLETTHEWGETEALPGWMWNEYGQGGYYMSTTGDGQEIYKADMSRAKKVKFEASKLNADRQQIEALGATSGQKTTLEQVEAAIQFTVKMQCVHDSKALQNHLEVLLELHHDTLTGAAL